MLNGEYNFLDAIVFAPSCDHIRRIGQYFDILNLKTNNEKYFFYMLDTPTKQNDHIYEWFAKGLRKLAGEFNERFNSNINEETLRESIKEFNEFNSLISSIGDMISSIAEDYDYVIIDGSDGIEQVNNIVTEKITHLVLLSDSSDKGIKDIKTINDYARASIEYEEVGLILNRVKTKEEAKKSNHQMIFLY